MPIIVDEKFQQSLFSDPSGQRKTPTIFDELRWAMEHAQNPLEQVTQLIAEFHGPFNGMTSCMAFVINELSKLGTAGALIQNTSSAINLIEGLTSALTSLVGRQNNINCSQMSIPLLREFVSRTQAMHPAINNYIQNNIGKFPYFQQISDEVGSLGKIVLLKTDIPPVDRINSDGKTTMETNSRLSRKTADKLFNKIHTLVDDSANLLDVLFLRAMSVENNMGLLQQSYGKAGTAIAHGHSFCMDAFNAQRNKDAVQPCLMKTIDKFGSRLELCDSFFPQKNESMGEPKIFELIAEGNKYKADGFNRPLTRQVIMPVASEEKKSSIQ